jgi:Spy/CpxP family protein refolding chaperone
MPIPRSQSNGSKRMVAAALLLGGVVLLAGCTASSVTDYVPTAAGGMPEGAPQRSANPPAYPAVNDTPRRRDSAVLTDEEQTRLENDLAKARDRLSGQGGSAGKDASAAKPAGSGRNP